MAVVEQGVRLLEQYSVCTDPQDKTLSKSKATPEVHLRNRKALRLKTWRDKEGGCVYRQ
jgi:hypothetical protein